MGSETGRLGVESTFSASTHDTRTSSKTNFLGCEVRSVVSLQGRRSERRCVCSAQYWGPLIIVTLVSSDRRWEVKSIAVSRKREVKRYGLPVFSEGVLQMRKFGPYS